MSHWKRGGEIRGKGCVPPGPPYLQDEVSLLQRAALRRQPALHYVLDEELTPQLQAILCTRESPCQCRSQADAGPPRGNPSPPAPWPAPAPHGALASPKAEHCNPGLRPGRFGAPSTACPRPRHQPRHRLLPRGCTATNQVTRPRDRGSGRASPSFCFCFTRTDVMGFIGTSRRGSRLKPDTRASPLVSPSWPKPLVERCRL